MPEPTASYDSFIEDHERSLMKAAGYGARTEPTAPFAVVVVDVTYSFCGRYPLPIREAVVQWHNACGQASWDAVGRIRELLDAARERSVPIFYTKSMGRGADDPAEGRQKNTRRGVGDERDNDIVEEIAPRQSDHVLEKSAPSAFFGTPLVSLLAAAGVKTVVVAGGVTSGCVRATVVDGYSYGFNVQVPHDACFDRLQKSHHVSLFEMDAKYADVVDTETALQMLGNG